MGHDGSAALDPYAPPKASDAGDPPAAAPSDDLSEAELNAFVGRNWLYYRSRWRRFLDRGEHPGFNVAAFFLSIFWMGYRKLYREAALLVLAWFGVGLLQGLLVEAIGGSDGTQALEKAVNIGIGGGLAAMANRIYLRRARIVVGHARARFPSEAERLAFLQRRGGTSVLGVLAAIAVSAGFVVLAIFGAQQEP